MGCLKDYPAEEFIKLHEHIKTLCQSDDEEVRARFANVHLMDFIGELPVLDEVLLTEYVAANDIDGVKDIIEKNPDVEVFPGGDHKRSPNDGWRVKELALVMAYSRSIEKPMWSDSLTRKDRAIRKARHPHLLRQYNQKNPLPLDAELALFKKKLPSKTAMADMLLQYRDWIEPKVGYVTADAFMARVAAYLQAALSKNRGDMLETAKYILHFLDIVRLGDATSVLAADYIDEIKQNAL